MTDECREAFEKEYPKHGGHYFSSSDRALMWGVWQAAWNARRSPDARNDALEEAAKAVPTNWCDPLLTGPRGLGNPPWTERHIVNLLNGVAASIRVLKDRAPDARGEPVAWRCVDRGGEVDYVETKEGADANRAAGCAVWPLYLRP